MPRRPRPFHLVTEPSECSEEEVVQALAKLIPILLRADKRRRQHEEQHRQTDADSEPTGESLLSHLEQP